LREHADDIGQIAEHWLQKVAQSSPLHAETGLKLTSDAHAALARHDYPGNVRELVNVIRRVSLFAQGGVVDGELVRRMLAEDPFRTLRPQAFTGPMGITESHSPQPETSAQQLTNGELSGPESRRLGATQHFPTSSLASQSRPLLVSVAAGAPLSLRELEIRHIEQLLREHKNITMVAKLLDIDRRTLQRKLRGLGIEWRDE
ncbi:MAG TPA: helix-turn-helix domain-containing protein, partial [Pseudomonadota bacterium]|nr:helix-turn-helix domain-containing protein [Pseudomonadota bacterium]